MLRYNPFGNNGAFGLVAFICAAFYLIYIFINVIWSHGKVVFGDAVTMFAMAVYIIGAMTSIVYVRFYGEVGKYIYLLIFLGAWMTDIFAYFTGFLFGKHKLIEDVSPKKTIEGAVGGVVGCVICTVVACVIRIKLGGDVNIIAFIPATMLFSAVSFVIFGLIVNKISDFNANIIFLAVSGVILSIVAQIGDLIMSVIKRHYKIKDFGKIFPGHGGMLDRFDSISAVSLGLGAICMFMTLTGITLL